MSRSLLGQHFEIPLQRHDELVWSRLFREWVHPRSAAALATQGYVLKEHSRFDVGHEMVLPERAREDHR